MAVVDPRQLVPTRLQDGDELTHPTDKRHSLSDLYGISAREIVALNEQKWDKFVIDAWVMSHDGKRLAFDPRNPFDATSKPPRGWAVFTRDSVILLPAGGPRPPASSSKAKKAGGLLGALGLLGTAWAFWPSPKPKRKRMINVSRGADRRWIEEE